MNFKQLKQILGSTSNPKYFLTVNFGCRVNVAEINLLSQILINSDYKPLNSNKTSNPNIILVNTCSITKKGEIESLSRVRILNRKYPNSKIFVTGCANLEKLSNLTNVYIFDNKAKEKILAENDCFYTSNIKDKFSHTNRYLLRIQSGCTQFCSYCTVPFKRSYLWSLSIDKAIEIVKLAISNAYKEIILTGVNLIQYQYGFSNLVESLLKETNIPLISFGSVPVNCIDEKLISLYKNEEYRKRLSNFIHIPIQSGSDKILKLMNRPYTQKTIIDKLATLKNEVPDIKIGTDIIIGFPGETDNDFIETFELCKNITFQKIHCFKYSSRPNTLAKTYYDSQPKINKEVLMKRSQQIRNLI